MSDLDQRIAGLSPAKRELLRQLAARQRAEGNRIQARPRPARVPLSFGQRRLWLLDRYAPGTVAYNSAIGLWLDGALDPVALRQALQFVLDRHESLRTVVRVADGVPHQVIQHGVALPWQAVRAAGGDAAARRRDALDAARASIRAPFDLSRDAMMRALLVTLDDAHHLLVLTCHHIAIDGWSFSQMQDDMQRAYDAIVGGAAPESLAATIAPPALQIADVALWQDETLGGEGLQPQLDYWQQKLTGVAAALDLPSDRARPAVQSHDGALWSAFVPAATYAALEQLARDRQATLSMIFLAAFQTLLARYTGQDDIAIGMGVAGRARRELEGVVGFFVNTLALRTDTSGDPPFTALLARVRDDVLGAMDHADAPLDRVLETLRLPRSASHTPLAQVMYFFQSYPDHALTLRGVTVTAAHASELAPGTAQGELSLFVNQHAPREIMFEYNTALFDRETIERLGGHLLTLLDGIAAAPDTAIGALPIITEAERAELSRWNDTRRALPAVPTIAAELAAQVARSPDAIALRFGDRALTYRELDRRGNALAHELRAAGVTAGSLVGLYVDRTIEMLVGLVGILKAGGAYVPLDPAYPADRLGYMLTTSQARVMVTSRALVAQAPAGAATVIVADADAALDARADAPPAGRPADDDLAYVIFTSGSTGKPKGVAIRQQAAVNLLRSVARAPGMTERDTLLAISTLSFDIALFELILPLTVGATIVLVDRDTARDGLALRRRLDERDVTMMQATPATWRMLLEVGWRGRDGLRIISTGEALPRELADRLLPCVDELWNLYGPTETTVYSALCRVHPGEGNILVGTPVDNTEIHIVDRRMRLLPAGIPGELLIGGEGLAAGYVGRPDLTAEKFIPDAHGPRAGGRVYRSGDLARWRRDGTIEVLGRIDHQIKLRGFRIELGEIETVLADHPAVTQAVVHCREDTPGDKRLVAYVTTSDPAPTHGALRDHLKVALPDYMVPSAYVVLDAFPLTPNGKVDRRALPAPKSDTPTGDAVTAPRTPEEAELVKTWAELLHVPTVDVRANFFDLGGHSLLATQLLARIEQAFGVELPLRTLFEAPTLEQLAARVAAAQEALAGDDLESLLASLEHLSDEEANARLTGAQASR